MEMNETLNEEIVPVNTSCEPVEESSGGKGIWVAAAIGTLAVGAVGIGLRKAKGKIEQYQIKKLEKKGYTIVKPDDDIEVEYVDVEDDSEEESPEESK